MTQTKNFGKQDPLIPCPCCGVGDLATQVYLVLEDVRRHFNGSPVTIGSGCRCESHHADIYMKLNKTPPLTSDHLINEDLESIGADISVKGRRPKDVYNYLASCPYSDLLALGLYEWGVHVGLRGYKARWSGYK